MPAHANDLVAIASDRTVIKYLSARIPHPYTLANAVEWIAAHPDADGTTHFAVERDGELLGAIGYELGSGERAGTAMLGYFFKPTAWGRGFATEATRLLTSHLFTKPAITRVWANVMAPNRASARVLEKADYVHEATLRSAILDRDGARHDELIYALLRE
jgi:ribosomal-protein-alanine N-acetyltransferase